MNAPGDQFTFPPVAVSGWRRPSNPNPTTADSTTPAARHKNVTRYVNARSPRKVGSLGSSDNSELKFVNFGQCRPSDCLSIYYRPVETDLLVIEWNAVFIGCGGVVAF